ncbi:GGDEF domain-containing protein [Sphingobium boeckii]|uniref:diguanylate cyclase n=1 Tax=Sphingobium boeckii TaxID=1082345 RepID=A0A7W9AJ93_9SPHN|nr:GGDEF domain-containing protein [Sphingobium boeckii]MBB5686484.1 diguanylate cyclase [Sphingobium boeckii]
MLGWIGDGGDQAEPETRPDIPPPIELDDTSRKIFQFFKQHGLDANPDHFHLAWTYFVSPLNSLSIAVDEALVRDGRLTEESAALLLSEYRASSVANDLAGLLVQAREGIADGSKVVKRSREDVAAFGVALRTELGETRQTRGSPDVDQLMQLTEAMIQKASEAEQELRGVSGQLAKMEKRVRTAERLAETDPLTGLPNRRAFNDDLEQAIARCRARGTPLSVAFCDIDHFKVINDTHGHATGDRVLKYISGILAGIANGSCHVARHGGEEFVILFRDQTVEKAIEIVDGIRETLALKKLVAMDTELPIGTVTFSAGVAQLGDESTAADLLHQADMALYRAKHSGRNRVCL